MKKGGLLFASNNKINTICFLLSLYIILHYHNVVIIEPLHSEKDNSDNKTM